MFDYSLHHFVRDHLGLFGDYAPHSSYDPIFAENSVSSAALSLSAAIAE
jgi:hypothetical protein